VQPWVPFLRSPLKKKGPKDWIPPKEPFHPKLYVRQPASKLQIAPLRQFLEKKTFFSKIFFFFKEGKKKLSHFRNLSNSWDSKRRDGVLVKGEEGVA